MKGLFAFVGLIFSLLFACLLIVGYENGEVPLGVCLAIFAFISLICLIGVIATKGD